MILINNFQECVEEKIEQLKLAIPPCTMVEEVDNEGDQTQKIWTQQPYSKKTLMKRQDVVCYIQYIILPI